MAHAMANQPSVPPIMRPPVEPCPDSDKVLALTAEARRKAVRKAAQEFAETNVELIRALSR